jgi:uncharacterized LabA/DUF88 family protein
LSDDRLKIAVFIDFDNIEIGVKNTLGTHFDIGAVLETIKERGEIVTKIAYGDWTRAGDYGRSLSQHAVHMVQRNLTPGGDKNGADINLALDALEMAFTHNHINSFVIVSGDSDFISLVEKLKQYDRKVFVVGGRAFTSVVMQKNCTEFMAYENVVGRGRSTDRNRAGGESSLAQAMPLVRRALKLLTDREVLPQLGLLKSTLLQLDSAFSEREYGASSFRDFVQKLAKAGYVNLKGSERSFHVELREGEPPAPPATRAETAPSHPAAASRVNGSPGREAGPPPAALEEAPADEHGAALRATPAETVRLVQQTLARANVSRWPLYMRQIKQLIRTVEPQFDERKLGFNSLMDLLKVCQREGVLRLERDRQGIIRVWPGQIDKAASSTPVAEDETRTLDNQTGVPAEQVNQSAGMDSDSASARDDHMPDSRLEPAIDPALPLEAELVASGEPRSTEDWNAPSDPPAEEAPKGRRRSRAPRATSRTRKPAEGTRRAATPRAPRAKKSGKTAEGPKTSEDV